APLPIGKKDLITELREMNFLETYEDSPDRDVMIDLLDCYHRLVVRLASLAGDWSFSQERLPHVARPFGTSVRSVFAKAQPMAAFGAECKSLIDKKVYRNVSEIVDA